jgi:hypothetical protein
MQFEQIEGFKGIKELERRKKANGQFSDSLR